MCKKVGYAIVLWAVSFFNQANNLDVSTNPYLETILYVSKQTGTSPTLLMAIAEKETNFRNIDAKNGGTAGGLFQFTDTTWDYLLNKHGDRYQIDASASKYSPYAATTMACAYLEESSWMLSDVLFRTPTESELYLSHLLGPTGASLLLTAPDQLKAKQVVPYAYPRNKRLFHKPNNQLYSVAEFIAQRHMEFEALISKYKTLPSIEQLPARHAIVL